MIKTTIELELTIDYRSYSQPAEPFCAPYTSEDVEIAAAKMGDRELTAREAKLLSDALRGALLDAIAKKEIDVE